MFIYLIKPSPLIYYIMLTIFHNHLSHLIIPIRKFSFEPHFVIQVLFIVNILGELIVGVGKYNLVSNIFLTLDGLILSLKKILMQL